MLTMWKLIALSNSLKIFKTENCLMKFWTRWKRYYMKLRGFPKKGWRRYIESCLLYMNIPVHSNDVLDMIWNSIKQFALFLYPMLHGNKMNDCICPMSLLIIFNHPLLWIFSIFMIIFLCQLPVYNRFSKWEREREREREFKNRKYKLWNDKKLPQRTLKT